MITRRLLCLLLTAHCSLALAAQAPVITGTAANDGTGDTLRSAFGKLNANDAELYTSVATINATIGALNKASFGLGSVENTALSTWPGSTSITQVGTVTTGAWHATAITDAYISSAAAWNAKQAALTAGVDYLAPAGNGSGLTGLTKAQVGLASVENTALSTWAGSSSLVTVGTLTSGTIGSGFTAIANARLANSAITIGGTSTALGGSITASAILDSIGSTRGSVLERGASGWAAVTPGASGYVWTSQGTGADPHWAAASGGGGSGTIATTGDILIGDGAGNAIASGLDPTSLLLKNGDGSLLTGVPIATGVSGLGAGVATYLATPTIANLQAATAEVARTDTAQTFSGLQTFAGGGGGPAIESQGRLDFSVATGEIAVAVGDPIRVAVDNSTPANYAASFFTPSSAGYHLEVRTDDGSVLGVSLAAINDFGGAANIVLAPSNGGAVRVTTFLKLVPGAAPGAVEEGQVYASAIDHHLYFYNGSGWVQLDN